MHKEKESFNEVMAFRFSEENHQVRSLMVNGEPKFVGSDIAKVLGYKEPHKAIARHCKHGMKHPIPTNGGLQNASIIPESDVYRLIINSDLPSAEKFERWVMEEVLPSLRKKGYYQMAAQKNNNFIDLRNQTYQRISINNQTVRTVIFDSKLYFSLKDLNKSVKSKTCTWQQSERLKDYCKKFWLIGATTPAWFIDEKGKELLAFTYKTINPNQLTLNA